MRFFHKLRYFCSDAWEEFRHSFGVNMMALGTLVCALFVAALVMLVLYNVDRRVSHLREELRVQVFMTESHATEQRDAIRELLATTDGVERVEWVDKQEALRRYREWAAQEAGLIEELGTNPLPASFEVYLRPGGGAGRAAARVETLLTGHPAVEQIRYDQPLIERLEGFVDLARRGGAAVAGLVLLAVIFVMASVLRLAVLRRTDEIKIMQLVGASAGFIRGPFLVAGLVQGAVATGIALGVVEGLRRLGLAASSGASREFVEFISGDPLSRFLAVALLAVGLFVSLAGSWFAVRQPT